MKQSKLVLTMEAATLVYMVAILWVLFPGWHSPLTKAWRSGVYRWHVGRDQIRFTPMPLWVQEAAQVRGRFEPRERAPRPLNLPM